MTRLKLKGELLVAPENSTESTPVEINKELRATGFKSCDVFALTKSNVVIIRVSGYLYKDLLEYIDTIVKCVKKAHYLPLGVVYAEDSERNLLYRVQVEAHKVHEPDIAELKYVFNDGSQIDYPSY